MSRLPFVGGAAFEGMALVMGGRGRAASSRKGLLVNTASGLLSQPSLFLPAAPLVLCLQMSPWGPSAVNTPGQEPEPVTALGGDGAENTGDGAHSLSHQPVTPPTPSQVSYSLNLLLEAGLSRCLFQSRGERMTPRGGCEGDPGGGWSVDVGF